MGLMSWIFGQFIDVIEWTDDSRDTMVWRFPRDDNEIKYGAKLIVRESQMAVFVNEGEIADVMGAGTYELDTNNLPILTDLLHWDHGFKSPFKAEVYFINTHRFTDLKWGTKAPIMVRDTEFQMVRLRAYGTYEIQIDDPKVFLKEIVGTDGHFTIDEIDAQLSNLIISKLANVLGADKTPMLDLAANYEIFGEHITKGITPFFTQYGLKLNKILVENISVPKEVQDAIDKRTSREITGNLDDNIKYQTGTALSNDKSSMSDMIGMGVGAALGQQMANTMHSGKSDAKIIPPIPIDSKGFYVSIDGEAEGPFSKKELISMIHKGELDKESYMWQYNNEKWQHAKEMIADLFEQTPPPIPE